MRPPILQTIAWLLFFVCAIARGAPGDVDPTFVYPRPQVLEPDSTNAIPLPNGFLVVKSRDFDKAEANSTLEVTRIDEDGRVVASYGIGGTVRIAMPGAVNVATAVKGMSDGSVLLAGFQRVAGAVPDNVAAIARLDATGRLDPTFGVAGIATFDVPGQVDRIGAIDALADGRILAGVWSQMIRDPYGDCSTDRVSLVRLNADGTRAEVIYYRERNQFTDNGCRNAMTLKVMPDQQFYFGSSVEIVAFSAPETGAWRPVVPLSIGLGPFSVDPALGPVWIRQGLWDGIAEVGTSVGTISAVGPLLPAAWFYGAGIPAPRTASVLVADGGRPGWFLGFSSDGGIAGIAKLRSNGEVDTGWAGIGMVRIAGAGRLNVTAIEGLANDIRLLSVRPGGERLVAVTADGIIERRFAQSGPAHGVLQIPAGSFQVRESAGAVRVSVRRVGGSDGAVSVDYRALTGGNNSDCRMDPCAQEGADYASTSGRLDWGDGDSSDRMITIPIIDDQQHEPGEVFEIELTGLTGGAVILGGASRQIDIIDDDPALPTSSGSGAGGSVSGGSGGGGAASWSFFALVGACLLARRRADRQAFLRRLSAVLASFACAAATSVAQAGIGDMDPTFGNGGVTRLQVIGLPLKDGRLLYQTNGGFGRTDVDGREDASFGIGGVRAWPAGFSPGPWARTRDGELLTAGKMAPSASGIGLALVRLRADGDVDSTFGDGGIVTLPSQMTPVSESRWVQQEIALQLDGRILVLTQVLRGAYDVIEAMELLRLMPDGTPDRAFGIGGVVTIDPGGSEYLHMEALSDGRIRISGDRTIYLTEAGAADPGVAVADPRLGAEARDWVLGAPTADGGRVLIARDGVSADGYRYFIARLTADGSLDRRFGQQGSGILTLSSPLASSWTTIGGFLCSADGRYVFASLSTGPYRAGLARYRASGPDAGSLDPTFGNGGIVELGRMFGVGPVIDTADGGVVVGAYPPAHFRLLGVDRPSPGFANLASDHQTLWPEDQGPIKVRISRLAGSSGPLRVRYSTTEFEPWPTDPIRPAKAGVDFESVSGELVWADGDREDKTFSIPLLTDSTTEPIEALLVELWSLTPGSWVGSEAAPLAIQDRTVQTPTPAPTPAPSPDSDNGRSGGGGAVGGALLALLALARGLSRRSAA
jgi:uncharacterized delta-60 repeat protein